MDCIPLIRDLELEIKILKALKSNDDAVKKKIQEKEKLIMFCKSNLQNMSSTNIEYRLYLKILSGKTPSQAVKEVADENFVDDIKPKGLTQIWKYYKKMKKMIKV